MFTIAVSPCSNPEMTLDEALAAYAELGYRRFEMFTGWAKSAANPLDAPQPYVDLAARHGFAYCCIHLPALSDDLEASVGEAARAARFGADIGCRCAIVKARTKQDFFAGTRRLIRQAGHELRLDQRDVGGGHVDGEAGPAVLKRDSGHGEASDGV